MSDARDHFRGFPALAGALVQIEASSPSEYLDVTVITRGKNDINTDRFLTQTAYFVS